jgi:zinc protease
MNAFGKVSVCALIYFVSLAPVTATAELDLRSAQVSRLDNGLTVLLLEDRNFPVVSVQSLYRVGARDETTGQTGLAHFLEHMAFRATESFPDTGVVSEIYARGGEWHGYTWIDQTTYFATVPNDHLDVLLRIEAERMSRLTIDAADMEAERGAVLAEMHGYENDPSTVLFDAVLFTSFLGHPYRNNTIGWQSDIENLRHEDVVAFYERHYVPANAVLAVVGDFDATAVSRRISELFSGIEAAAATPLPHTVEPPQSGARRVRLSGPGTAKHFKIAYRAPSASSADFAAFLVLQDWLGGSSGISFLQNDWGTAVRPESLLGDVPNDLTTWFPPSAQDYVFLISGTAAADSDESMIEKLVEEHLAKTRTTLPDEGSVAASIDRILDELVFDVETTEDAAHQLAYFDGLGALEVLLTLPEALQAVTEKDVQSVARRYLQPWQRTIGWWVPAELPERSAAAPPRRTFELPAKIAVADTEPVSGPVVSRLRNGLPVIMTASDLSPAAYLRVVMPNSADKEPVFGHASLESRFRPDEVADAIAASRRALAALENAGVAPLSADPETRLEQAMTQIMGRQLQSASAAPSLILVAGDLQENTVIELLEKSFGDVQVATAMAASKPAQPRADFEISMGRPLAQAQLGYLQSAPGPREPDSYAYRLLLYILSHDYEGRLGKIAISDRGLAYYIDSRYRSDGETAWITLATGVDPQKLATLRALFRAELERLGKEPPTAAEIEEARNHLVGRAISAAQSNEELTAEQAKQWIWFGRLQSPDELREQLERISDDRVRAVAAEFARGTIITVTDF